MSRAGLLQTIRSAVDSLRSALQELEDSQDTWELVEAEEVRHHSASGSSDRPAASSVPLPVVDSPPVVETVPAASPCAGAPLPGDALFLVSSLHRADRRPRAQRAWDAGLQARAVLQGLQFCPDATPSIPVRNRIYVVLRCRDDRAVRVFTTFGRFKLHTGPLEHSSTVCHGFPTEGEARVYVRAAGLEFPDREAWS